MDNYETYIIKFKGEAIRLVDASSSNHARKHASAILTAERGTYREVQEALNTGLKIERADPIEPKKEKQNG